MWHSFFLFCFLVVNYRGVRRGGLFPCTDFTKRQNLKTLRAQVPSYTVMKWKTDVCVHCNFSLFLFWNGIFFGTNFFVTQNIMIYSYFYPPTNLKHQIDNLHDKMKTDVPPKLKRLNDSNCSNLKVLLVVILSSNIWEIFL